MMQDTGQTIDKQRLEIDVDSEHGGLRVLIFGIFIGVWILGFIVFSQFVGGGDLNLLAIGMGLVVAYLVCMGAERLLKRRWKSGRVLVGDADQVCLVKRGTSEQCIPFTDDVDVMRWCFQTTRRSRVPKGWYVVASALRQGDAYISVYTFMSPTDYKALDPDETFTRLRAKKESEKAQGREDLLLAGEQRRLLMAEQYRWNEGAEMTQDDFRAYLSYLQNVGVEQGS